MTENDEVLEEARARFGHLKKEDRDLALLNLGADLLSVSQTNQGLFEDLLNQMDDLHSQRFGYDKIVLSLDIKMNKMDNKVEKMGKKVKDLLKSNQELTTQVKKMTKKLGTIEEKLNHPVVSSREDEMFCEVVEKKSPSTGFYAKAPKKLTPTDGEHIQKKEGEWRFLCPYVSIVILKYFNFQIFFQ